MTAAAKPKMKAAPRELPHPTPTERQEAGKRARAETPRVVHAQLPLNGERDPVGQIEREAEGRVPELLPIRYGRMLASPFAFYRGTAGLMATDLGGCPSSGVRTQLCGDAHLANFGGFASPDRSLVFDLNDFDETLPGPFEWDVKRLATSFEIAARHRNIAENVRRRLVVDVVAGYRRAMREFAGMRNLDVWYSRLDATDIAAEFRSLHDEARAKNVERTTAKARKKDSGRALTRLTEMVGDEPRIRSQPPLIVPIDELLDTEVDREHLQDGVRTLLRAYRRTLQRDRRTLLESYRYVDLARKVVGVGSVGTRCWIVLMLGRDANDPLVLQVKEATASSLEPHLPRSGFSNNGQRIVEGQRLMQAASDVFLGWIRNPLGLDGAERDFYVRQLWDWKVSVDLETLDPEMFAFYARMCGWTLARAHARAGDRIAIAAYLGKNDVFDRAVAEFAAAYADLSESDFRALDAAAAAGRIIAERQ
jgi:uncharacterized protein (DUF2252 family)